MTSVGTANTLLADAGYDGEWVLEFLRDELDIRAIIQPTMASMSGQMIMLVSITPM